MAAMCYMAVAAHRGAPRRKGRAAAAAAPPPAGEPRAGSAPRRAEGRPARSRSAYFLPPHPRPAGHSQAVPPAEEAARPGGKALAVAPVPPGGPSPAAEPHLRNAPLSDPASGSRGSRGRLGGEDSGVPHSTCSHLSPSHHHGISAPGTLALPPLRRVRWYPKRCGRFGQDSEPLH